VSLIKNLRTSWSANYSLQPKNTTERIEVMEIQKLKQHAANELIRKNIALSIAINTLLLAEKNGLITDTIWTENEPPETLIDLLENALDDPHEKIIDYLSIPK
jgi:hypothetical protein